MQTGMTPVLFPMVSPVLVCLPHRGSPSICCWMDEGWVGSWVEKWNNAYGCPGGSWQSWGELMCVVWKWEDLGSGATLGCHPIINFYLLLSQRGQGKLIRGLFVCFCFCFSFLPVCISHLVGVYLPEFLLHDFKVMAASELTRAELRMTSPREARAVS